MRKSLFALPLLAAGFVFACGGSDREGFATFKPATEPTPDSGAGQEPGFAAGEDGVNVDEDGGCASSSTSITRTPVVLEFVVDESGSMAGDKWEAQRDSLIAAFEDMHVTADPALFVGIQLFGDSPNTKVKPKMVNDDHHDDLIDIVDKPAPAGTGTGSEKALIAGYKIVNDFKPPASSGLDSSSVKKILVFMSDGAPSGGDAEKTRCETLVGEQLANEKVQTFSIGVGEFPSSSPGSYDPAFMGRLSVAGGTPLTPGCDPASTDETAVCHFQVTPGGDVDALKDAFIAAINKIRALSASCEFGFTLTEGADPNDIKVTMTGADGKVTTIKKSKSNGWSYDNDEAPTKVILNGAACSASNGTVSGRIDVRFGCGKAK